MLLGWAIYLVSYSSIMCSHTLDGRNLAPNGAGFLPATILPMAVWILSMIYIHLYLYTSKVVQTDHENMANVSMFNSISSKFPHRNDDTTIVLSDTIQELLVPVILALGTTACKTGFLTLTVCFIGRLIAHKRTREAPGIFKIPPFWMYHKCTYRRIQYTYNIMVMVTGGVFILFS